MANDVSHKEHDAEPKGFVDVKTNGGAGELQQKLLDQCNTQFS